MRSLSITIQWLSIFVCVCVIQRTILNHIPDFEFKETFKIKTALFMSSIGIEAAS